MSFNDVRRISYDNLSRRVKTDKPYKDSANAYPLGERRYSDRHFRSEPDGTFSIWYADRELVDNRYGRINDKTTLYKNNEDYYRGRMIGVVHPDNSFEFVSKTSQGENTLLCHALNAWIHHEKAKGGTVYEKYRIGNSGKLTHPVFRGLRINCDTGEATTPYSMFLLKLKRKAASEVMSAYQEFITVFNTMIDSMDDRGIWEVFEDLYKNEAGGDREKWRTLDVSSVKRLIDEKKYVDAGCLFSLNGKGSHLRWRVEWAMQNEIQSGPQSLSHGWKEQAKREVGTNFRKMILRQHLDVFELIELEAGRPLPTSQWGVEVRVGNQSVVRL